MFTGIVQETGRLLALHREGLSARIEIAADKVLQDAQLGDSLCCNGCCLTVTSIGEKRFAADLSWETLERTSFASTRIGDWINLEPALRPMDRMGGHLVSGHVDGTGIIDTLEEQGESWMLRIQFSEILAPYVAEKGSFCVDGMSLTVAQAGNDWASFAIIPFTIENTNLQKRRPRDIVNLEVDILARYVERLLSFSKGRPTGLSFEKMRDYGYINE